MVALLLTQEALIQLDSKSMNQDESVNARIRTIVSRPLDGNPSLSKSCLCGMVRPTGAAAVAGLPRVTRRQRQAIEDAITQAELCTAGTTDTVGAVGASRSAEAVGREAAADATALEAGVTEDSGFPAQSAEYENLAEASPAAA